MVSAPISTKFDGVYAAIQSILAIIQGPTIALLFVGMFWARATPAGGFVGLTIGLGTSIGLTIGHKIQPIFTAEEPFFYIAPISCLVTVVVLVIYSFYSVPKSPEALRGLVYDRSFGAGTGEGAEGHPV